MLLTAVELAEDIWESAGEGVALALAGGVPGLELGLLPSPLFVLLLVESLLFSFLR